MVSFYYTVTSGYKDQQDNPTLSLGGYVSSTNIQNDNDGNVFGEISLNMMANPKKEYRAVVIVNEGVDVLRDFSFYFKENETDICTYKVGAILMHGDEDKGYFMERIPTRNSKPMSVSFESATETDPVTIGDLEPNKPIGLWIERTIDREKAGNDYNHVAEVDPINPKRYIKVEKNKEESIDLRFNWL